MEPEFYSATTEDIYQAANLAADAFKTFCNVSGGDRAAFLRRIVDQLTAEGSAIVQRPHLETGVPVPRLQGELKRTAGQLNCLPMCWKKTHG